MLTVYLADLRHDYGGVLSTDCMPLGAGYMKAVMDRDLPADQVRTELFAYPLDLLTTMKARPPDVLMVSNYVWNEALSLHALAFAKRLNPRALTVMGGPNIAVEPDRSAAFVAANRQLDVYVLGEGDFVARDLVKHFLAVGCSVEGLGELDIPSCIHRRADGTLASTEPPARSAGRDVNDIPSPWLTGVMDKFFDDSLSPIIETNRGCPFRCSFCVQGTGYYNRIVHFALDRLQAEIDYIERKISQHCPHVGTLRITDANYGMYSRDTEISKFIGQAQRRNGWPTFIDATTGKNRSESIIRSMEQVNGALVLYQAVQSLDEDVLRNVHRSNIKLDAYRDMHVYLRGRGLRTSTDLILGLPGESLRSHLAALHKMIDLGADQAHCFQAMMLKGSELESMQTRKQFQFHTRFRVLPKSFGEYEGDFVFDIEEIVVATETLPFEDYIRCRKQHVAFSIFWNDSWFKDAVTVAQRFDVRPSEWLTAMLAAAEADDGPAGELFRDFVVETKGELFESREACVKFYSEPANFERLHAGRIGDNLMYKYRAIASFFLWREICGLAMHATARMLRERGAAEQISDFDTLWADLHAYVFAGHATGTEVAALLQPETIPLRYDIPRWLADGAPLETGEYLLENPREAVFRLSTDSSRELQAALKVWPASTMGLSKLVTRLKITSQVRQCELREAAIDHERDGVARDG